jgi:hypothetical protein
MKTTMMLAALAILLASPVTAETQWWMSMSKETAVKFGLTDWTPSTACAQLMSPGNFYDGAKQNGENPTLREYKLGVLVTFTVNGVEQGVPFFRTLADCQSFNQLEEDQSNSEKKAIDKYR